MKTEKVKINGQVELEIEEGMSVSERNGVVKVSSLETLLTDQMNWLIANMVENAREKWTPKDGDFVTLDEKWVSIYSGKGATDTTIADYYGAGLPGSGLNHSGSSGARLRAVHVSLRPSTQPEMEFLLDVIKKNGLTWNAEKRAIEKLRWRAEPGGSYEYVNSCCGRALSAETCDDLAFLHNWRFESGNYYKPGTGQAQKAADKINEIFRSNL